MSFIQSQQYSTNGYKIHVFNLCCWSEQTIKKILVFIKMGNGRTRDLLYTSTHLVTPLHCYMYNMAEDGHSSPGNTKWCNELFSIQFTKKKYEIRIWSNVYIQCICQGANLNILNLWGGGGRGWWGGGGVVMGRGVATMFSCMERQTRIAWERVWQLIHCWCQHMHFTKFLICVHFYINWLYI